MRLRKEKHSMNPGAEAGKKARELHRLAFPDSYKDEDDKGGNPAGPEEGAAPASQPPADDTDKGKPEDGEAPNAKPAAPAGGEEKDADYWRQRFEVMQGKYNAEVPRLTGQVSDLTERVNALSTDLQSAQAGAADLAGKTVDEALDDLEDEYGDKFVAAIDRRIDARLDQRLDARLNPVEQRVQKVEQASSESAINAALDQMHAMGQLADWRTLNEDPDFITWLQNPAPFSGGKTFLQILRTAYASGHAVDTAEIFNTYEHLNKKPDPPAAKPDKAEPPVSPPRRGGGPQAQIDNANGDVLRMSDFQQLHRDYQDGKYRGREAEYQKKKAAFHKAAQEGRLIG
jgi:hypothetical protein